MEYTEFRRIAVSAMKKRGMRLDDESIHDIATLLWEDSKRFKSGHLGAWLCQHAGFHALNMQRRRCRENWSGKIQAIPDTFDVPENGDNRLINDEAIEELEKAIKLAGLKKAEKSLLLLYYGHGITLKNIAAQMRCSPQAVFNRIRGLVARLRLFSMGESNV